MTLLDNKIQLRKELIRKRHSLTFIRRSEASNSALHRLKEEMDSFQTVLSFAPKPEEIDIWPLNELLAQENKLLLPRVSNSSLIAFPVSNVKKDLSIQSFGVLQPSCPNKAPTHLNNIDCILVPALGFTNEGARLGYGMGYYDRLLTSHHHAKVIGIAYQEQMLDYIPEESHDKRVDVVYFF